MSKPKTKKKPTEPLKTFDVVYNNLNSKQQTAFKKFVKEDLKKASRQTIRNWVNAKSEPAHVEQLLIAKYLGVNQELLFPTKK